MILKIITTQRSAQHDVAWVELNTPVGNMVVAPGHVPTIVELSQGSELLYQLTDGTTQSVHVVQGVAHVSRTEVKVLLPMDL